LDTACPAAIEEVRGEHKVVGIQIHVWKCTQMQPEAPELCSSLDA
jgi:hypothetical protein